MNNFVLLDTHILLWVLLSPDELSERVKDQIRLAQETNQLLISSISLWEIAMLKAKRRINIYEPIKDFLSHIVKAKGVTVKDISADIAAESAILQNFHGDPADRLIVSTALVYSATLLTRDQKILNYAEQAGSIKIINA